MEPKAAKKLNSWGVGVENGASFEILQVSMSETWESAMPPWMVSMP